MSRSDALRKYWASLNSDARRKRATVLDDAARKKISDKAKLRVHDQATKEKIAASLRGKTLSEETKKKIGVAGSGRKHTAETKAKMSSVQKGRVISSEHRAKLSAAMTGKRLSPEHRAKVVKALMRPGRLSGKPYVSRAERKLAEELTKAGIPFEPQKRVGKYWVDFCLGNKAVEVDGVYWHSLPGRKEKDKVRDANLQRLGYTVIHILEPDVWRDVGLVVKMLKGVT